MMCTFSDGVKPFLDHLTRRQRRSNTLTSYFATLERANLFFTSRYGDLSLNEMSSVVHAEAYLDHLSNQSLKATSIRLYIATLKSYFDWAIDQGYTTTNPFARMRIRVVARPPLVTITEAESKLLFAHIKDDMIRMMLQTEAWAGLRISEICRLAVTDVDIARQIIHVIDGKGGRDRDVPISTELAHSLDYYLEWERPNVDHALFFLSKRKKQMSPDTLNRVLKEISLELFDRPLTTHDLRHYYATSLLKQNVDVIYVNRLLGHNSLNTTNLYLHPDFEMIQQSIRDIDPQAKPK